MIFIWVASAGTIKKFTLKRVDKKKSKCYKLFYEVWGEKSFNFVDNKNKLNYLKYLLD